VFGVQLGAIAPARFVAGALLALQGCGEKEMDTVRLFVGFDQREAAAYHVFCQSVIAKATCPVAFHPLTSNILGGFDGQRDGTNAFIFSRYLVPWACNYNGWAIFMDGDMVCTADIAELWAYRDVYIDKAIAVVQHDYRTKHARKYVGTKLESANVDYPRKNWSSVMLINCGHYANRKLDPEYVSTASPAELHRLAWLDDKYIGALPVQWNMLVGEDPPGPAFVHHFTLGVPGMKHYADDTASWHWHGNLLMALQCAGEKQSDMVSRAEERIGEL
jgi:lipopolysaccharide biosynthesis glycosyltransferase